VGLLIKNPGFSAKAAAPIPHRADNFSAQAQ
jgi:hypothetical protein